MMIEHSYGVVTLSNGMQVMSIQFPEEEHQMIGTFLANDVDAFDYWITDTIDAVLAGEKEEDSFGGNVCSIYITPETTTIENDLSQEEEPCIVDTKELRGLIGEYLEKKSEFYNRRM